MGERRAGTLLAFDFGMKRIGVAVGQEVTGTARPLTTIPGTGAAPDWEAVTRLIREWRPDALVVGVPYNLDGSEHALTRAARRFMDELASRYGLPVHGMDERLTSVEARRMLAEARRSRRLRCRLLPGDRDRVAAQVILQSWLDQHKADHDRTC